jgi:tetratricopeptide (TPR) repeat protein
MPEAVQRFQESIQSTDNPDLKADAYYNLGNAFFQQQQFDESIKAYKESLKLRPSDTDTKRNLMLAMRQLQQQEQPQQEQQQQEQQQEQPQQQQQESPQQPQENKEGEEPSKDLSEEEAREILKAIEREDQRVQEKLKKVSGKKDPPVKDW